MKELCQALHFLAQNSGSEQGARRVHDPDLNIPRCMHT
jgi:hypothetical protein